VFSSVVRCVLIRCTGAAIEAPTQSARGSETAHGTLANGSQGITSFAIWLSMLRRRRCRIQAIDSSRNELVLPVEAASMLAF
jgi:hypothetical protein